MTRFEDILIWQKAKALTVEIYRIFSPSRDFGFRDQIQRASVSIMNNVAEGFERKGHKEFLHFLSIAKGSCGEVRSMLELAKDLAYIQESQYHGLTEQSLEISRMIAGLMKSIEEKN
jgi:four helix bundle protein